MKTVLSPLMKRRGYQRCAHCGLIAQPVHMKPASYDETKVVCVDDNACDRRWFRGLCGESDDG